MKTIQYIATLLVSTAILTACGDDDHYDILGDPHNRVYINHNKSAYQMIQTDLINKSNLDFTFDVQCTQPATSDIKVEAEIDNTLIQAYNSEHGTAYEALPVQALVIENKTATIAKGTTAPIAPTHISLTTDENILKQLNSDNGYIVPVRLGNIEGASAKLSTNMADPVYITLNVSHRLINPDASVSDITGTEVADQSQWTCTPLGTTTGTNLERMFDGNPRLSASLVDNENNNADFYVDMGRVITLDAVVGTAGNNRLNARLAGKMSVSLDAKNWTEVGTLQKAMKYVVLFVPITARYIRFETGKYSCNCSEFNVYEIK